MGYTKNPIRPVAEGDDMMSGLVGNLFPGGAAVVEEIVVEYNSASISR
jgi:hypothetical protein